MFEASLDESPTPQGPSSLRSPVPWAAGGVALIVAAARYVPGEMAALAAALAAALLSLVVGAAILRVDLFDVFRLPGAGILAAAVAQGAWPVGQAVGVDLGPYPTWVGAQTLTAVCLVQHLRGTRWPLPQACGLGLIVALAAATAAAWFSPAPAAWTPVVPGALFLWLLVHLGRARALWRPGPDRWLVLSAAGGIGQAAIWAAGSTPWPAAAASLCAMAVPIGLLLAALDRVHVLFLEADTEASNFRDANRALVLSSDLARRLQRRVEALRAVREAVHDMTAAADFERVLAAVRAALDGLRVPYNFCCVNVVEKSGDGYVVQSHGLDTADQWQVTPTEGDSTVIRSWQGGEVIYRSDLHEEDPYDEREMLEYLFAHDIRSVVDVPFSHGTLGVNSTAASAFDKETLSDLKGLVEVLSEGFRRRDEMRRRRQVEDRLDSFFTHSLDLLCVATFDGHLQMVNPAWTQTLGYAADELVSRPLQEFIHPQDLRQALTSVAHLRRGTPTITFENRFVHKDGSHRWLSWTAARDPEGVYIYGTAHDVTGRVAAEQQMREAKEAAEGARMAQSQFLANMNHELRTPLNAIIGYSELLMEEAEDEGADAAALEDLGRIHSSAQHLLQMINEVLELSRIEAGRVELRLERVFLAELLEEATTSLQLELAERGIHFSVDIHEQAPQTLHTDRVKLRQILRHLLSNAGKFTEQGQVVLTATTADRNGEHGLEVSVRDTGVGMTAEQLEGIFDAFRQVDGSSRRRQGGTGLGLTITRRLCEMLGGQIEARSTLGSGSTFTLWVPVTVREQPFHPDPATAVHPNRQGHP